MGGCASYLVGVPNNYPRPHFIHATLKALSSNVDEPPLQTSWNRPCNADQVWAPRVEWMEAWEDVWVCQLSSGVRSFSDRIFIYVHILCTRLGRRCQAM